MLADKDLVENLIPQGYPVIMVHELISSNDDTTISGLHITEHNIFCSNGYFREPGIIENIAQTAALRSGYDAYIKNETPSVGYIGSVKKLRIFKLPKYGDLLITKITITGQFDKVLLVAAESKVNDYKVAEGEMNIFLQ